jgi:hypothetical protein
MTNVSRFKISNNKPQNLENYSDLNQHKFFVNSAYRTVLLHGFFTGKDVLNAVEKNQDIIEDL